MRISSIALAMLLSSPLLSGTLSAQSATVAAPPPANSACSTSPQGTACSTLPADWVLSMDAKLMLQLAQMKQSTTAIHPSTRGCPIGFWAEREGSLGLRQAKNPNRNPGPGLDLSFHSGQRSVVEAGITVYGWSSEPRMVPAAYPSETSESFVLHGASDDPLIQSLVWMKRLGVVNSVELTRLVFSDGATWTQTGDLHCTVTPSKLLLVNASSLK